MLVVGLLCNTEKPQNRRCNGHFFANTSTIYSRILAAITSRLFFFFFFDKTILSRDLGQSCSIWLRQSLPHFSQWDMVLIFITDLYIRFSFWRPKLIRWQEMFNMLFCIWWLHLHANRIQSNWCVRSPAVMREKMSGQDVQLCGWACWEMTATFIFIINHLHLTLLLLTCLKGSLQVGIQDMWLRIVKIYNFIWMTTSGVWLLPNSKLVIESKVKYLSFFLIWTSGKLKGQVFVLLF